MSALPARIAELERQTERLTRLVSAAQPLLDDAKRLADLAEQAGRLSAAADATLKTLGDNAAPLGIGRPRVHAKLDTVHRAEVHGYVSAYFTGGKTATIRLMAGPQDPPTECIGEADAGSEFNSYVGGIIRQGEFWMVASDRDRTDLGFGCVFTPLF